MKEFLTEEIINTTSVLLYKLSPPGNPSLEEFHEIISQHATLFKHFFEPRRFRGIYKIPDDPAFICASGFECDPKRPNKFFNDDFMDIFYDVFAKMHPHLIAVICTTDYLSRCAHTENAREALLCFDNNNEYILTARKEIQKVVGGLPTINKLLSHRLENVA